MLPKKDGKQRGLPTKLGANVTAATDVGGTVVTSPRDATGAGAAAAAAAAAASHPPPPPAAEQLPKDSMRLSSLGDWLSKVLGGGPSLCVGGFGDPSAAR